MIDIHSHILPNFDDGAESLEESVAMARLAVAGGTTVMFATPHVAENIELQRASEIPARVAELQAILDQEEIPLRLLAGAEVYPMNGLMDAISSGCPLLLAPRYNTILLDAAFTMMPMGLDTWVFNLQAHGLQVIFGHPERVMPVQQNPQILEGLVSRGMLLQINATSLFGGGGDMARQTVETLLRLNWVHFVASDCHSSTRRSPSMAKAEQSLVELAGAEVARTLLRDNGQRLIDGESVPTDPQPYTSKKRRGLLDRLFGRP